MTRNPAAGEDIKVFNQRTRATQIRSGRWRWSVPEARQQAFQRKNRAPSHTRRSREVELKIRCQQWRVGSIPTTGSLENKGFAKSDPSRANPAKGRLFAGLLAKRPKNESIDHVGRGRRSVASMLGRGTTWHRHANDNV